MNYNEVNLSGIINNILINDSYIVLGLTCNKYSPSENNNVYASLRVYKDLYEKNKGLFLLNKKLYIKGYLNSYTDKNKKIHNYVTVIQVGEQELNNGIGPIITYDVDGVEMWDGKRLENEPFTEEDSIEYDRILASIIGDSRE